MTKILNVEAIVKKPIEAIWRKYEQYGFTNFPPIGVKEIPTKSLLFIGINPSLSQEKQLRFKNSEDKEMEFYELSQKDENGHQYFKKFIQIAESVGMTWTHIDLLYVQETRQAKVKETIHKKHGNDFLFEQIMVSKRVIEAAKPKIIVVNNTLARDLMGYGINGNTNIWMSLDFRWFEEIGTYKVDETPVFFTSMLTGQRALDIGSFKRLIWHIKFVNKQLNTA